MSELDAIRGIAALAVLLQHFFTLPGKDTLPHAFQLALHVFHPMLGGYEAVLLFFVLSGFVLFLPVQRGKAPEYQIYVVRRAFRIYLPYLAALLFAVVGAYCLHGHLNYYNDHTWVKPVSWSLVLSHIIFIGLYDYGQFNMAFWTLVIEMRVSLIYPYIARAILTLSWGQTLAIALALSAISVSVAALGDTNLRDLALTAQYSTLFMIGALLARHIESLRGWYRRLTVAHRWGFVSISFALYGYGLRSLFRLFHLTLDSPGAHLCDWVTAIGVAGLVIAGLSDSVIGQLLRSPVPQFLGRISYSLYLVHSTVLLILVYLLEGRVPYLSQFPIFIAVSLVSATAFCIWIEEPCMLKGREYGRADSWKVRPLRA